MEKYDGDLKQLAEDIGDLHYEALWDFIRQLRMKIGEDATKDHKACRK